MMRVVVVSASIVLAAACGGDTERGIKSDSKDSGGAEVAEVTAPSETGDSAETTTEPPLPNACDDSQACDDGTCRSGVCVNDPPASLVAHATNPVGNVPSDEWPDLTCVDDQAPPANALVPQLTATLHGAVSRFGKGRTTAGIHVEVMRLADFDPSACEGLTDEDEVKACFRGLGPTIGATVATEVPNAELPEVCTHHEECPLGYQCNDPAELGGDCVKDFGLYEIPNVPLEEPLIIRSYATSNEALWHDTWVFNVVLHQHHVVDGKVQYDATMVSHGQWLLVTNTVSLPEIPPERGVVGGRIRDCRAGDGLEGWPIANVHLDMARPARKIVYFNDLEDDTVPLVDRQTTDIIGRFAALDIEAGWNRIAGSARVDGAVVSVGGADVYVIPNSLSIVSWPGTQPYWRQK